MFEDLKPQPKKLGIQNQELRIKNGAGEAGKKVEDIFSDAGVDKDRPFLNEANEEYKKKIEKEAKEKDVSGNKKKIIFISFSVSAVILIIVFFVVLNKFNFLNFTEEAPVAEKEQMPAETGLPAETSLPEQTNQEENLNIMPAQPESPQPEIIDTDGDGLTDEEEAKLGASPNNVDTDGDGLSDREEINVYKTDPLNPDTDSDGYLDGVEVKGGYNPKGEGKLYGNF
ncbi:MAG: hypothetical protein V1655_00875 [bacterium]